MRLEVSINFATEFTTCNLMYRVSDNLQASHTLNNAEAQNWTQLFN